MPNTPSDDALEARLRDLLAAPPAPRDRCPEDAVLAAWIDGRLDEAATDRVEAHLAACGPCLDAVCAARAALADARRPPARRAADPPFVIALRWGLAAAAAVAVAVLGFWCGRTTNDAAPTSESESIVTAMTFGVFDAADERDGLDLVVLLSREETP